LHTQLTLAKNSDNKQHLALVLSVCCLDVRRCGFVTGRIEYFCGIFGEKAMIFSQVKLEKPFQDCFAVACRRPYFCLGKSKQNQCPAKLAIHGSNSCGTASLQTHLESTLNHLKRGLASTPLSQHKEAP